MNSTKGNGPTTDEFGHRVPTHEEMGESHPDEAHDKSEQAIEEEMTIRAMRFYNER